MKKMRFNFKSALLIFALGVSGVSLGQCGIMGDESMVNYYYDFDGDGFELSGNGGSACSEDIVQPFVEGMSEGNDCDDANITYYDGDGDTFGAENFAGCNGVENNLDCNDENSDIGPLADLYTDADDDGYTVGALMTSLCNDGVGFSSSSAGEDCDDSNATASTQPTISSSTPASRCGTGSVDLNAAASAGSVNWYANISGGSVLIQDETYTTPSISSTTTYYAEAVNGACVSAVRTPVTATVYACNPGLNAYACGLTIANKDAALYCKKVIGATNYRYIIQHASSGYYRTYTRASADTMLKLSWFGDIPENSGYTYSIRVAFHDGSNWSAFGTPCSVTIMTPEVKLISASCNVTLTSLSTALYSENIAGATEYRYIIQKSGFYRTFYRVTPGDRMLKLSWFQAIINDGSTYSIRVSAKLASGQWTTYGTACNVTVPGASLAQPNDSDSKDSELLSDFSLETYPNPNNGTFTISSSHEGKFNLVNELGQLIQTIEISKENNLETKIEGLTQGVYFVTGIINDEVTTKKVIVQ